MSHVITKRARLSRRVFLKGVTLSGAPISIGIPPLAMMFNANGTAYAAEPAAVVTKAAEPAAVVTKKDAPIESRFVVWFNGNGIPERYWIPTETGPNYTMTPCLAPLAPFREDIHVISGLDNPAARLPGPGNDHHRSMSALVTGTQFTGRGAGGPSIDQAIAAKLGLPPVR